MIIEFNKPLNEYFNGFMITEDYNIITKYNNEKETHNGCYFLVKKTNNTLEITQDFFGCYGAYVYIENEYFAISDCLMELSNFLKGKLTLNHKYYNRLINAREVAFSLTETVFNEIKRYNGSYKIIVNNKIKIEKIDYQINSINFDNPDYLKILDRWYFKWLNIFKKLKGDIVQDLSGGIDTRILLSMAINSDMLNNILFRNKKYNPNILGNESKEDRKIAQSIINKYNLRELKKILLKKELDYSNNYIFGNSNFSGSIREKPVKLIYRITGNGGLLYHRPNTFKNLLNVRFFNINKEMIEDYKKLKEEIEFPIYMQNELKDLYIYRKLIVELRDGIKSADYFRNNTIILSPMMDPELNMLNINIGDKSVLPTIILKRYCRELLNFDIEGINEKNIDLNIEVPSFNYKINNSIFNKNNNIPFFYIKKEVYEKKLSFKSLKDNSHSTGTSIPQTKEFINEYFKL